MTTTESRPATTPPPAPASVDDVRRTVASVRRRSRRRLVVMLAAGAALALVFAMIAISSGAASVPPDRVLATLLGQGDRTEQLVVFKLRLPRILAAVFVGAAFGLAGAIFQAVLRNPLASPDILGVSAGASLGAVWAILGLGLAGVVVSGFALAGALVVALVIWATAWRQGLHGVRFVLVGVGLAYVCGSLIAWLLARAEVRQAQAALLWTVGSVSDVRGDALVLVGIGVVIGCLLTAAFARGLPVLALGDDHAISLGVRTDVRRGILLLVAVLLIAIATSVAGPIAFVALIAPAIARRLVDDGSAALAASTMTGAVLTLGSDVLGQFALPQFTAPVGIVTGLIGAPYLLWLLARTERKARA
ncbi:iron chelate uptake ABC transporter family permease subunit [Agromyces sp. Leaf222]|uniref:FecCD family ABC transporter permease n=1 Tax=Agromyces sp. Leaf222 TaxID=1735688 RepID=UPI0006FBD87A|nr:iron ABC transporter permease [Agromyces sp. Leaf222]KQM84056.1 ABC transporter permease [Agromyces sp. Leaf222]